MGFEDDYNPAGTVTQINRYALGARGIDRIARTESGNTTLAYPLYDGHGNMRALLTRDGTEYDTGNWKTYDVWGSVRSGGSSADPKQGYVASIGHVSDSESSLIYMRARYYEPATGRFISEDPEKDGKNWFVYAANAPAHYVDRSGTTIEESFGWVVFWSGIAIMTAAAFAPPALTAIDLSFAITSLKIAWGTFMTDLKYMRSLGMNWRNAMHTAFKNMQAVIKGLDGSQWLGHIGARVAIGIAGYVLAVWGIGVFLGVFDPC